MCVYVQIFENELKDQEREVCFVDIAYDEIPERYYKESEVSSRWRGSNPDLRRKLDRPQ